MTRKIATKIEQGQMFPLVVDKSRPGTRHCAPCARVDVTVVEAREKAVLLKTDKGAVWFPRAAIRFDGVLAEFAGWFRFDPRQSAWWDRSAYFWMP